ncbi:MAG TPA: hypothetical protein ENG90_09250 [Gammaproteobacteria bacterium]|nr:hypothetical protein [Gammaproteobacteria bacterium]HDH16647.1 hypothetical protein [Gammaproteobacteria bacterium]HDZ79016.1 hypothetical protein [Gammaproteobacteria bacterium]
MYDVRKGIWDRYCSSGEKISYLAESYRVTRQVVYKVLARARKLRVQVPKRCQ